jgi:hypothetical protein
MVVTVRHPQASSPRVPVTIRSVAASRIAMVSAAVTSTTGVFIVARSRCQSPRVVALESQWSGKIIFGYAGIGIAMLTLIDSTVRLTITHSDSEQIASVAATASVSLAEATGAEWPLKPKAPGDRIMAGILQGGANHPANTRNLAGIAGNNAAVAGRKTAE